MLDLYFFNLINGLADKWHWLDVFGVFSAEYLGYILVIIIFLFLLKDRKRYWRMVVYGLGAGAFARLGLAEIIHWIFPRSRPFVNNNVHLLLNYPNIPSFPSGHASFFFALSTVVYFYNRTTGILFVLASLLICLGRVFVGVHWPSDVIAGAVIGIFSGWVTFKLLKNF